MYDRILKRMREKKKLAICDICRKGEARPARDT
jgi:hypothetical protein